MMFLWLNDKRKGLYLQSCIFINLFYKIDDCIYLIKIYSLVILIFLLFIMIDYSISDPTNQIWINLELYFKIYDFYNF